MKVSIRKETPADVLAIHRLNVAAFETAAEARLVDALRASGALTLSLVAEADADVVGHIAFSPVTVTSEEGEVAHGLGLAPMAVLPSHQRAGVGSQLVKEGLRWLRESGHGFCVVLGHADYYPRFGFAPASRFGLRWEIAVPDEAFMVQALVPDGLANMTGVVRYHPAFAEV